MCTVITMYILNQNSTSTDNEKSTKQCYASTHLFSVWNLSKSSWKINRKSYHQQLSIISWSGMDFMDQKSMKSM